MKFSADNAALLRALDTTIKAAMGKSPSEVFRCILLRAEADAVTLRATDLNRYVSTRVEGVDVEKPGSVLIRGAELRGVLSSATDERVAVESSDFDAVVTSSGGEFRVRGLDPEDFPTTVFEVADSAVLATIPAVSLLLARRRVMFALDDGGDGGSYGGKDGVHVLAESEASVRFAATDGRRLSVVSVDAAGCGETVKDVLLSRGLLALLPDKVEPSTAQATVRVSQRNVRIEIGSSVFGSRSLDGKFPDIDRVIPVKAKPLFVAKASDMVAALLRVRTFTDKISAVVEVRTLKDAVELSSSGEGGRARQVVPVKDSVPDRAVSFMIPKLIDGYRAVEPSADVSFYLDDKAKNMPPVLLTDGTGWRYVLAQVTSQAPALK